MRTSPPFGQLNERKGNHVEAPRSRITEDVSSHELRGFGIEAFRDMRVEIERDPDRRVPETLRDDLRMDAGLQRQSRVRMTKVVVMPTSA